MILHDTRRNLNDIYSSVCFTSLDRPREIARRPRLSCSRGKLRAWFSSYFITGVSMLSFHYFEVSKNFLRHRSTLFGQRVSATCNSACWEMTSSLYLWLVAPGWRWIYLRLLIPAIHSLGDRGPKWLGRGAICSPAFHQDNFSNLAKSGDSASKSNDTTSQDFANIPVEKITES